MDMHMHHLQGCSHPHPFQIQRHTRTMRVHVRVGVRESQHTLDFSG